MSGFLVAVLSDISSQKTPSQLVRSQSLLCTVFIIVSGIQPSSRTQGLGRAVPVPAQEVQPAPGAAELILQLF